MAERLAILGAGKIGESLLAGLLSSGWTDVVVTSRRQARVDELRERYGVQATLSNAKAVAGANVVVLAVKPQDFPALLGEIAPSISTEQTVLSVAAAIPTAQIESRPSRAVARVGDGRGHRCLGLRPGVLRTPRRGDDRGGHPPRPLTRSVDP